MESCLLRDCPKCGHGTVQFKGSKVVNSCWYDYESRDSFPKGKRGSKLFVQSYESVQKQNNARREANTVVTHTCTVCGKRWVDCVIKEIWGGSVQRTTHRTREEVSEYYNSVKLK